MAGGGAPVYGGEAQLANQGEKEEKKGLGDFGVASRYPWKAYGGSRDDELVKPIVSGSGYLSCDGLLVLRAWLAIEVGKRGGASAATYEERLIVRCKTTRCRGGGGFHRRCPARLRARERRRWRR
jgi:hypothetical protein